MNTIKEKFEYEFVINKSRFIGIIMPLSSVDEVKDLLKKVSQDYPKATHYCYAYVKDGVNKSNDDGEPSGTAGRPILEVILKRKLNNVLLVVVRYFGGIKLGAGGLLRAYVEGASGVINKSKLYHYQKLKNYLLTIGYNVNEILKRFLEMQNIAIRDIMYQDNIKYLISCPDLNQDEIKDYMQGKIEIEYINEEEVLIEGEI